MNENELFGNSEQLNDTISRAAVVDEIEGVDWYHIERGMTLTGIVEALNMTPPVDAVPVKHGRWKEDTGGYGFWICSACGFVSEASAANMLYKFCPVCGAKMDGKDGGENDV